MYDARSRSVCVRFCFLGFWVMQIVVEENKIHENNKKKKKTNSLREQNAPLRAEAHTDETRIIRIHA